MQYPFTNFAHRLKDVTGIIGEDLVELALLEYSGFSYPLFSPAFLGATWPVLDYYIELTTSPGQGLYFFAQSKATTLPPGKRVKNLRISTKRSDIEGLLRVAAPTYIFGVHTPTRKVFVRGVHASTPKKAITTIPLIYELTPQNLRRLHNEVVDYWTDPTRGPRKPAGSVFA